MRHTPGQHLSEAAARLDAFVPRLQQAAGDAIAALAPIGGAPSARGGTARRVWALAAVLAALSLLPALGAVDPKQQLDFAKGLYERKLYSLAVPEFEKFLKSHPKHAGAATASYLLAHCYRGSGDWVKAAAAYEAALRTYPKDPQADGALFSLGQCYLRLEQLDKAAATFTRQIETSKDPEALAQARY
ncbi:MAG TPA: tetratricopeptide repeat protein, partial [Armatimonadota bacterium]|nr:tetratricopeptide repeat protein [Armatimonadota bacterium]